MGFLKHQALLVEKLDSVCSSQKGKAHSFNSVFTCINGIIRPDWFAAEFYKFLV